MEAYVHRGGRKIAAVAGNSELAERPSARLGAGRGRWCYATCARCSYRQELSGQWPAQADLIQEPASFAAPIKVRSTSSSRATGGSSCRQHRRAVLQPAQPAAPGLAEQIQVSIASLRAWGRFRRSAREMVPPDRQTWRRPGRRRTTMCTMPAHYRRSPATTRQLKTPTAGDSSS